MEAKSNSIFLSQKLMASRLNRNCDYNVSSKNKRGRRARKDLLSHSLRDECNKCTRAKNKETFELHKKGFFANHAFKIDD